MIGSFSQNVGDWAENVACWWLKRKGYEIIKKHHTSRFGEIDIIACDKGQVVFIEVKFRSVLNGVAPEQYVGREKRKRMRKTILSYISQKSIENYRVDVVSLYFLEPKRKIKIRHHKAVPGFFDIR